MKALLNRIQKFEDDRCLAWHGGKADRHIYTIAEILDSQYMAISIHFDREREHLQARIYSSKPTWRAVYEERLDEIDTLERDLSLYREVYNGFVTLGYDKAQVLVLLNNLHALAIIKPKIAQIAKQNAELYYLTLAYEYRDLRNKYSELAADIDMLLCYMA